MATEEKLTITERAADGTETTVEITARTVEPEEVEEKGLLEPGGGRYLRPGRRRAGRRDSTLPDGDRGDHSTTVPPTHVEMHVSQDVYQQAVSATPVIVDGAFVPDLPVPEVAPVLPGVEAGIESGSERADAVRDVQASADAFVALGDYRAAVDAREAAERASWDAGRSQHAGRVRRTGLDARRRPTGSGARVSRPAG